MLDHGTSPNVKFHTAPSEQKYRSHWEVYMESLSTKLALEKGRTSLSKGDWDDGDSRPNYLAGRSCSMEGSSPDIDDVFGLSAALREIGS
jgi:hypothetical protein